MKVRIKRVVVGRGWGVGGAGFNLPGRQSTDHGSARDLDATHDSDRPTIHRHSLPLIRCVLGTRPTFDTHIPGFPSDISGSQIKLQHLIVEEFETNQK